MYNSNETYISKEEVHKHGIVAHEVGRELGFRTGDRIININGKDYSTFNDLLSPDLLLGESSYYTIERNGQLFKINLGNNFIDRLQGKNPNESFISLAVPFSIDDVMPESGASEAGLQEGDKILSVNEHRTQFFHELKEELNKNINKTVTLEVEREGKLIKLLAKVPDSGKLGFSVKFGINYSTIRYTLAEAILKGTQEAFINVWKIIRGLGKKFSGEISASKELSGPVGIAKAYGQWWDWELFWTYTGTFSMVIALINLLPFPMLDGQKIIVLIYEIVFRKKTPSVAK